MAGYLKAREPVSLITRLGPSPKTSEPRNPIAQL